LYLIIDTNVLFAFFGNKRIVEIFEELYSKGVKLIVPQFVMEELKKLESELIKRSGEKEFKDSFELLENLLEVVPQTKYSQYLDEAKRLSPHAKDAPLFALSSAFNKAPIWSREPRLKKQKVIKVLSDKEVERLLQTKK
jgi:predicted nucleic acid-binding protein